VNSLTIAAVILRIALGSTMLAHGWNHAFGGGGLQGTANWFSSIGIRPGKVHALFATLVELGAGAFLVLGLLTPFAAAGVIGTMSVALIAEHLKRGYFIFRPGQGYEYVLMIILVACALAALGGGTWSIDNAIGFRVDGWTGLLLAAVLGGAGGGLLLATSWRPKSLVTSAT
jgi:putative oxidoreductase